MNVALAVVAGIAIGGAVLAVSARDVRGAVLGVLIIFLASPFLADPLPGPVAILARIAAALLAARLMTIGLRGEDSSSGTRIGWPAEALAAGAAAVVGFGSHGLGADALGPPAAQAAGFALIALAIAPLVTGRDVLRLGIGSVLLVMGAVLVQVGLDAPIPEGEQLVVGLLTIGLGGAVGAISAAARAAGGLAVANVPAGVGPRPPDAHREVARAEPSPGARARLPRLPGLPGDSGALPLPPANPEPAKPRRTKPEPAKARPQPAPARPSPVEPPADEPAAVDAPAVPTPTPKPKPKPRPSRPRSPDSRSGGAR